MDMNLSKLLAIVEDRGPGMPPMPPQLMGAQIVRHDLVNEQQQQCLLSLKTKTGFS